MSEADRLKWDARHASGEMASPPAWLDEIAQHLPVAGRALDVACGRGRVSTWLARRGYRTLGVDISQVALQRLQERADSEQLPLHTMALDLEEAALPAGPFACISCFHYLQRDLFPAMIARLAKSGALVVELPTRDNLQRHAHPSARFLLEPGELQRLLAPLEIVHLEEGWFDDHALSRCVARRRQ